MSTHEIFSQRHVVEGSTDRGFDLTVGGILLGVVVPSSLRLLNTGWTKPTFGYRRVRNVGSMFALVGMMLVLVEGSIWGFSNLAGTAWHTSKTNDAGFGDLPIFARIASAAEPAGPSPYVPAGYHLRFSDEFDEASFDVDHDGGERWISGWQAWNTRALSGNSDNAFKMFDAETFNEMPFGIGDYLRLDGRWKDRSGYLHEVSNGTIKLRSYPMPAAAASELWGYSHVAGMLSSELSHAQQYGYFEVRARFNSFSKGMHFSLWTLAKQPKWPPEIDILDVIYKEPLQFNSGHIGNSEDDAPQPEGDGVNWYDPPNGKFFDWHIWSMIWTEDNIRLFINGKQVHHVANFIEEPMYFLATWEIGGNWPGALDETTVWPGEVEIDYIRIYGR